MKLVSRKSEWFIFAGFAMVIVASVAHAFLPNIDNNFKTLIEYRKYLEMKHAWQYLLVGQLNAIGTVVLAASLLIIGLRLIRINLIKVKATLFLVAGLGICAFALTVSYKAMNFDYSIPNPNPEILKRNIESHNYDTKLKSKLSRMYASDKYKYEGKTVEYFSETGVNLQYQPSKDDLEFRERDVLAKEMWSDIQRRSRRNFYTWCGITIVSVMLGFFTPVRKKHPTLA
jgi:hypothetical protein